MVEDIRLVCHEGLVLESGLQSLDAFLVLLELEIGEALFVQDLWVGGIAFTGSLQVSNRLLELVHVEVALRTVFQEVNVVRLFL